MDSLLVQQLAQAMSDGRNAIKEVVLGLKDAMPEVWTVLIRQVYVDAIQYLGVTIICFSIIGVWYWWWKVHEFESIKSKREAKTGGIMKDHVVQTVHKSYPECEKLAEIHDKSQVIGEFLDWLNSEGIYLCEEISEKLFPIRDTIEFLLADFFGIDMKKVEEERQSMLDDIRKDRR